MSRRLPAIALAVCFLVGCSSERDAPELPALPGEPDGTGGVPVLVASTTVAPTSTLALAVAPPTPPWSNVSAPAVLPDPPTTPEPPQRTTRRTQPPAPPPPPEEPPEATEGPPTATPPPTRDTVIPEPEVPHDECCADPAPAAAPDPAPAVPAVPETPPPFRPPDTQADAPRTPRAPATPDTPATPAP